MIRYGVGMDACGVGLYSEPPPDRWADWMTVGLHGIKSNHAMILPFARW